MQTQKEYWHHFKLFNHFVILVASSRDSAIWVGVVSEPVRSPMARFMHHSRTLKTWERRWQPAEAPPTHSFMMNKAKILIHESVSYLFINEFHSVIQSLIAHVQSNHLSISMAEGASLEKERTRKAPNCFHFRRQIMIMQRSGAGNSESQLQDTDLL